jgi:hypothetical protein
MKSGSAKISYFLTYPKKLGKYLRNLKNRWKEKVKEIIHNSSWRFNYFFNSFSGLTGPNYSDLKWIEQVYFTKPNRPRK